MNVDSVINEVSDPATRRALHAVFSTLSDDMASNKATFDGHTHADDNGLTGVHNTSTPQSDAEDTSENTATSFQNQLK